MFNMDKAFVISGEASESDDEEKVVLSVVRCREKSTIAENKGVIVAGEASESENESEESFREAFFARSGAIKNEVDDDDLQSTRYDTLLHNKLRDCNISLHNNICTQSRQSLTNGIKVFNSTNQQLLATQVQMQDAVTAFNRAFQNLTKLNDSLKTLLATAYIPEINV